MGSSKNPLTIQKWLANQGGFCMICTIDVIVMFGAIVYIRSIVAIALISISEVLSLAEGCWRQPSCRDMGRDIDDR